ncbi:MAG: MvaI/BcnI family restriction endonuclease [Holophagales bacterium]|nr:MvaI/BcnI family restriction endonuclease [Holophagales bacterium]
MKNYTKQSLIEALREIRKRGWIENLRQGNAGAIGNTLEDLLGIDENNLPIPNASEWELKTQRIGTNSLITLFHMEPSPTAYKIVSQILLPKYGWKHKEAGNRYPNDEMSFRQTINTENYSDRGFIVEVDRKSRKIVISFDHTKIDNRHYEWKKAIEQRVGLSQITPQPYWGFDDLFHKAGTKLHNCFFVRAELENRQNKEFFRYQDILMLKKLSLEKFIHAIDTGTIFVDFDARTKHNHGTKFRVKQSTIPELYCEIKEL